MSKLITVFGSTGNQGCSVIRAILSHPELSREWRIRGVTRDPSKPIAEELAQKGVQMVAADLSNKSSLLEAIRGSDAVFGVTNYWENDSLEHEVMQGKNLASAAKESGIDHLIWSSLPYASKITHGRLQNLHHFDSKAMIEEYIREIGVPASFVMPGYFMSNILGSLRESRDGKSYAFAWILSSQTLIPLLDVQVDFGKFVAACLLHPEKTKGEHILATSAWYNPQDIGRCLMMATDIPTLYYQMPLEALEGSPEMLDNFLMIRDYDYYGPHAHEGVKRAHELVGANADFTFLLDYLKRT